MHNGVIIAVKVIANNSNTINISVDRYLVEKNVLVNIS